ncbi:MAG: hypothetical protein M1834_000861 [Cirrosporium novae-zelandiae]|nr:MAG: hypothetical protein M1834_000861 [Cirrosporium novae-zelandiae]
MAQPELSTRLPIPIATSSLLQIPTIIPLLPPTQTIGILTFDATRLNSKHLTQLNIPPSLASTIPIIGCPSPGALRSVIRDGKPYVHEVLEAELVACAKELVKRFPNVGAIVLECTQMPPFAEAVARETRLMVFDVVSLGRWFYGGLVRRGFAEWTEREVAEAGVVRERGTGERVESAVGVGAGGV